VVLPGERAGVSTSDPARVITASVDSGSISDTEPIRVVLPTPMGPTTRIFAAADTPADT
jgi:hypothetical protein